MRIASAPLSGATGRESVLFHGTLSRILDFNDWYSSLIKLLRGSCHPLIAMDAQQIGSMALRVAVEGKRKPRSRRRSVLLLTTYSLVQDVLGWRMNEWDIFGLKIVVKLDGSIFAISERFGPVLTQIKTLAVSLRRPRERPS
jgi:hypothetical protein